jgi:hypothetical protein
MGIHGIRSFLAFLKNPGLRGENIGRINRYGFLYHPPLLFSIPVAFILGHIGKITTRGRVYNVNWTTSWFTRRLHPKTRINEGLAPAYFGSNPHTPIGFLTLNLDRTNSRRQPVRSR